MSLCLWISLVASTSWADVRPVHKTEETCDLIELNHVYDSMGRHVLSQLVFWEYRSNHQFVVRSWRLLKYLTVLPVRDFIRKDWVYQYPEGLWASDNGPLITTRVVRAKAFQETWTQYDVEMDNRDLVLPEHRHHFLFERANARW